MRRGAETERESEREREAGLKAEKWKERDDFWMQEGETQGALTPDVWLLRR